jgi:5-methylcytosine-specific restriction endonuclease McrA
MYQNRNRNSKELSRMRKPNSRYSDNRFINNILRPSYDKNYRAKHLWTVGSELQKGKCNLCTKKLVNGDMIVDHIVQKQYFPKYGQKINEVQNFQVLCSKCNSMKTQKVDSKINGLIKQNDSRTHSYDVLRIYTMNLLRKIYRENNESLAKAKETINNDNDSSDSSDSEEESENEKAVQKVFSKLESKSNNDDIEYDESNNDEEVNTNTNSNSNSNKDSDDSESSDSESETENKKKFIETKVKNKNTPIRVIRTRSKSGSLPKKIEPFVPQNISVSKTKNVKRKATNQYVDESDDESDNESDEKTINQLQPSFKKQCVEEREENSTKITKKHNGKYISLIFKNCNFSNCNISL